MAERMQRDVLTNIRPAGVFCLPQGTTENTGDLTGILSLLYYAAAQIVVFVLLTCKIYHPKHIIQLKPKIVVAYISTVSTICVCINY